jgi:hypothetical protein
LQRSIIAPAERVTNLRWGMVALVAAVVFILSIDSIIRVLRGPAEIGRYAFLVAALVAPLPAGALLDRFGIRRAGAGAAVLWAVSIFATTAGDPDLTIAATAGLGAAWSFALPLAAKTTASWFPRRERGFASAIVALAATLPALIPFDRIVPLVPPGSLPLAFGIAALAGAALLGFVYRDADDARVTYAERTYIVEGGAQPVAVEPVGATLTAIVRTPAVWAMAFAFGALGYAYSVMPARAWVARYEALAFVIVALASGALADAAAQRASDSAPAVKGLYALGTLVAAAGFGIASAHVGRDLPAVLLAAVGYALALPMAWSIPGRIAPRGGVGTVAAIMAFAGVLGGVAGTLGVDLAGAAAAALISAVTVVAGIRRFEPTSPAGISI